MLYKIKDIKHIESEETRTDDTYPLRIGCLVKFQFPVKTNEQMCLQYIKNNKNEPKSGFLVSSKVINFEKIVGPSKGDLEIIVYTQNSIYHFVKVAADE